MFMEENYFIKLVLSWDVLDIPILFDNNMCSSFPPLRNPLIPKKYNSMKDKNIKCMKDFTYMA
jgi:hypothetical protein